MASLCLTHITKQYDSDRPVLQDLSLRVDAGQWAVVMGPSGAGKTTLLRLIAGLETPSAGSVTINGKPVESLSPPARDVAMVFQDCPLYPHMSVYQNLAFGIQGRGWKRAEIAQQVQEVAAWLHIEDLLRDKPTRLSGGQRQRVAVGKALVRRPQVFLFDEPFSHVDAELRDSLRSQLKNRLADRAAAVVYVTHDPTEAQVLADQRYQLNQGHLVPLE